MIREKIMERMKNGFDFLLLRILLSIIVFLLIPHELALYLFVFTGLVAFLDGFLAKRDRIRSQLRSILDPFADKLLVNLTAIALYFNGMIPLWLMLVFLVKDMIMVVGAIAVMINNSKTIFRSNVIDKFAVFIQLLTLFVILTGKIDYVLVGISVTMVAFSLILTIFRSGMVVVPYKTDLEEIRFHKLVKLPDLFTLLNISMGLAAILFAINGRHYLAILSLLLAVVFDFLDGKIARMIKRQGEFGKQLDSLADTISFGVAPAVFGFSLIQTNFALVIFAIFLFAGVLRLARYNIMEFSGSFAGMPITVNGIVIPLIYFAKLPVNLYPYIYLFLALLMVSPVQFKKIF